MKRGWFTHFGGFLHRLFGGIALHKSLERNKQAARDLDVALREVLQK